MKLLKKSYKIENLDLPEGLKIMLAQEGYNSIYQVQYAIMYGKTSSIYTLTDCKIFFTAISKLDDVYQIDDSLLEFINTSKKLTIREKAVWTDFLSGASIDKISKHMNLSIDKIESIICSAQKKYKNSLKPKTNAPRSLSINLNVNNYILNKLAEAGYVFTSDILKDIENNIFKVKGLGRKSIEKLKIAIDICEKTDLYFPIEKIWIREKIKQYNLVEEFKANTIYRFIIDPEDRYIHPNINDGIVIANNKEEAIEKIRGIYGENKIINESNIYLRLISSSDLEL